MIDYFFKWICSGGIRRVHCPTYFLYPILPHSAVTLVFFLDTCVFPTADHFFTTPSHYFLFLLRIRSSCAGNDPFIEDKVYPNPLFRAPHISQNRSTLYNYWRNWCTNSLLHVRLVVRVHHLRFDHSPSCETQRVAINLIFYVWLTDQIVFADIAQSGT